MAWPVFIKSLKNHKNGQKKHIHRDGKYVCFPEREKLGLSASWYGVSFGADENVLELDSVEGWTTL